MPDRVDFPLFECHGDFNHMSARDKAGWAVRTIERALKGEKVS